MKLAIERKVLLPALSAVIGSIARKNSLPILSYLHVVGDGESLTLTGSDLETTSRARVRDVVHTPFVALWPARRMVEIVKSYPEDGIIGIAQDESEKLVIKCGRSRFSLQTLDPQDYPVMDERMDFDHQFTLGQDALRTSLSTIDFAMAKNDVRYYLMGILLHGQQQRINFVATDGHRLAKTACDLENLFTQDWEAILPAEAIAEIKKACDEGPCEIAVRQNMTRFTFDGGDRMLLIKHVDGRFPDYPRVIPRDLPKRVVVDRQDFLNALQRVRLVLNDTDTGIQLHLANGMLELGAGASIEQANDQIDAEYSGDELVIGMNPAYLIDALRVMESTTVELCCDTPQTAMVLVNPDQLEDIFVVMPTRL